VSRALALLLALTSVPAVGAANDLPTAQKRVFEATKFFQARDYEKALAALREAETIVAPLNDPSLAAIRFNLARCLEELGRQPEALAAYEAYSKLPDEPHRKQRAWRAIQKLEQRVYGAVSVTCDKVGATVQIPGLADVPEPCPFTRKRVPMGAYTAQVRRPGSEPVDREFTVEAGGGAVLQVQLVDVPSATPALIVPEMPPPEAPINPWPWATLGVGAALIGGGVGLGQWAVGARDDAETLPPGKTRDTAVEDFESRRTLSYAAYGLGGAVMAAGVALFFVDFGDDPETAWLRVSGPGAVEVRF
jgi:tetratricopeptide (TPR) repeat protein